MFESPEFVSFRGWLVKEWVRVVVMAVWASMMRPVPNPTKISKMGNTIKIS